MCNKLLIGVLTAGLAMAIPAELAAHGGQYRGPEDVVPPNPGKRGAPNPITPRGPKDPITPRPPMPITPDPRPPGTGPHPGLPGSPNPGQPITGGMEIPEDLSRWAFWWEFNKDPFIKLKAAIADAGEITRGGATYYLGPGQQVALEDAISRRRHDGHLQQVGVGVAEAVNSDAADEVEAGAAVGEPHPRAASSAAPEGREEEDAPALPLELAQRALVHVGREGALLGLLRHGGDQGACRFAHRRGVEQALQGAGAIPGHGSPNYRPPRRPACAQVRKSV